MQLILELSAGAVLTFSAPGSAGPYPWLTRTDPLQLAAHYGYTDTTSSGANPSITLDLDNRGRQAATLIGFPMRARATLLTDDGDPYFAGLVSAITFGLYVSLSVDS